MRHILVGLLLMLGVAGQQPQPRETDKAKEDTKPAFEAVPQPTQAINPLTGEPGMHPQAIPVQKGAQGEDDRQNEEAEQQEEERRHNNVLILLAALSVTGFFLASVRYLYVAIHKYDEWREYSRLEEALRQLKANVNPKQADDAQPYFDAAWMALEKAKGIAVNNAVGDIWQHLEEARKALLRAVTKDARLQVAENYRLNVRNAWGRSFISCVINKPRTK